MLKYLTGDRNTKEPPEPEPGPGAARALRPRPPRPGRPGAANYTQADVVEVSRALSGWRYNWSDRRDLLRRRLLGRRAQDLPRRRPGCGRPRRRAWPPSSPTRPGGATCPPGSYRELTGLTATPAVLPGPPPGLGRRRQPEGPRAGHRPAPRVPGRRHDLQPDQEPRSSASWPPPACCGWPGLRHRRRACRGCSTRLAQHPMTPPNVSGWPKGDQWLNASNLHVWGELANEHGHPGLRLVRGPGRPDQPDGAGGLHADGPAATAAGRAMKQAGLAPVSARTLSALPDLRHGRRAGPRPGPPACSTSSSCPPSSWPTEEPAMTPSSHPAVLPPGHRRRPGAPLPAGRLLLPGPRRRGQPRPEPAVGHPGRSSSSSWPAATTS